MVEVITYMATEVELRVVEKRLITPVIRLATTFAKLLFVVLFRTF